MAAYMLRTLVYGLPPQSPDDTALLLKSIVLQKYVLFGTLAWYLVFSVRLLCTFNVESPQ